jgi:hypothetical protein
LVENGPARLDEWRFRRQGLHQVARGRLLGV